MGGGWLSKRATALPFLHPHMDEGGRGGVGLSRQAPRPKAKARGLALDVSKFFPILLPEKSGVDTFVLFSILLSPYAATSP